MKRFYFALAVLAMAAITGCQTKELEYESYAPKKGEVVFRLANSNTRSAEVASVQGVTIPFGDDGDGNQLFLEETITRLDDVSYESFAPATKGAPAYTQNFSDLYGDFKAAAFKSNSGVFESSAFDDGVFDKVGNALWKRMYPTEVEDGFPLYFFLRAPYDLEGLAVNDLEYNTNNGSISFTYDGSSLTSASAQKDLLFTSRKVEVGEYENLINQAEAIPVLFHHALTGIKFANFFSNPDEDLDVKTYITKVEISGLADGGKCVITPRQETISGTAGYIDNTGEFSSKTASVWSDLTYGDSNNQPVVYVQSFDKSDETDFAANGNFGDNGSYSGTSFGQAGNLNNLTKADGSLIFWFVPQQLTEDVMLTISYTVVNTKFQDKTYNGTETIAFGDMTRTKTETQETTTEGEGDDATTTTTTIVEYGEYATWKAGELRTYTLKPRYVEVELHDDMSDDGFEKDNVIVTNNGNVWEYVRVNIIGNWVGQVQYEEGKFTTEYTILNGFTSSEGTTRLEAWNDKDGKTHYGTFKGLVPKSPSIIPPGQTDETYIVNNWVRYDKYYYYIHAIGPNESITEDVFESYTVGVSPEVWIADKWGTLRPAQDVHLIMDVLVQAIPAETDINGNITDNYLDAWVKALGKTSRDALLDL